MIVLEYGQTEVEEAINTVRTMYDFFKKRTWEPKRIGKREFAIEFQMKAHSIT